MANEVNEDETLRSTSRSSSTQMSNTVIVKISSPLDGTSYFICPERTESRTLEFAVAVNSSCPPVHSQDNADAVD